MPPIAFLHDSPLGTWRHTDWWPSSLRGVVERIWHFDGLTAHRRERAFPNGLSELIVQLGGPYREARGGGTAFERCGIQTAPTVIEGPEQSGCVAAIWVDGRVDPRPARLHQDPIAQQAGYYDQSPYHPWLPNDRRRLTFLQDGTGVSVSVSVSGPPTT